MIIAITSGKGGTGKSCAASYIGVSMTKLKKRTLIIEMGHNARSVDLILGTSNDVLFDFFDVIKDSNNIKKAVVQTPYENLYFMAGPLISGISMPDLGWFVNFFDILNEAFDVILLDGVDFRSFPTKLADTIVMVTTPESLSIRACAMHARALYDSEAENIKLIINSVSTQVIPMYGARDFDDVIDIIGAQLIGVIPESPTMKYSSNNAQPVDSLSLTVEVFNNIAKRLLGEHPTLLVK